MNKDCLWEILGWLAPRVIHLRLVCRHWDRWVLEYYNREGYRARANYSGKFRNLIYSPKEDFGRLVLHAYTQYYLNYLFWWRPKVNYFPLRLQVDSLEDRWLPSLTQLVTLSVARYSGAVEALAQLTNLTSADLPNDCLAGILPLLKLRSLTLSKVHQKVNPQLLSQMTQLTQLSLIIEKSGVEASLALLTNLTSLTVTNYGFGSFTGTCFLTLTELKYLQLGGLPLNYSVASYLSHLRNLDEFVNYNLFVTRADMDLLRSLTRLTLRYGDGNGGMVAAGLTNLRSLSFDNYHGATLEKITSELTQLTQLQVSKLTPLDQQQLQNLPQLRSLTYFGQDPLNLSHLTGLRELYCSCLHSVSFLPPSLRYLQTPKIDPFSLADAQKRGLTVNIRSIR